VTSTEQESATRHPDDNERWFSALGYLGFLCFLALWKGRDSAFVRFHARQGFLLFLAECVAFVLLVVLEKTIGRLPFLGLVVVVLAQGLVYLVALFLSVMGFVKGLFGERWEMPFVGPYGEKVPLL